MILLSEEDLKILFPNEEQQRIFKEFVANFKLLLDTQYIRLTVSEYAFKPEDL